MRKDVPLGLRLRKLIVGMKNYVWKQRGGDGGRFMSIEMSGIVKIEMRGHDKKLACCCIFGG